MAAEAVAADAAAEDVAVTTGVLAIKTTVTISRITMEIQIAKTASRRARRTAAISQNDYREQQATLMAALKALVFHQWRRNCD